jgi:hypothetical protein
MSFSLLGINRKRPWVIERHRMRLNDEQKGKQRAVPPRF